MDEDSDLKLSPFALEALSSFYSERDAHAQQFEDLKAQADDAGDAQKQWSMSSFVEDWNASQFWYTDKTAAAYAKELLAGATSATSIAVVSTPSVYIQLKNMTAALPAAQRPQLALLDVDERFRVFGADFVPYDFAQPCKLPDALRGAFDRFIVDPPFLTPDCQTKEALTVWWLARAKGPERLIVCTGERVQGLVLKLYERAGVRTTTYVPEHEGLKNEFLCYANFESDLWGFGQPGAA